MSTNKTEKFNLHLWEATDDFLRTEFNENFAALDAAGRVLYGSYTGDASRERMIQLGVTPKAVFVIPNRDPICQGSTSNGGLALQGTPVVIQRDNLPVVKVVEGGFLVYYEYDREGTIGSNSGDRRFLAWY